jgi:hypothetical protein
MTADLILALYAVGASAVFVGTYALGHRHGRAYVSDRTFGPVAAWGRVEAASDRLEELAEDEPISLWPTQADYDRAQLARIERRASHDGARCVICDERRAS